jgi:diacylglycerol O-acyltransferase / wax synthase
MTAVPRRALIISADIGEGHNSAGRALAETIARIWPGCQVDWLDTLSVLGPGIAPIARAFYVAQVQRTPWMYEFFFSAMWRHRWYLSSTRRFIGWWCGRRLRPRIQALDPDVIISTYPIGSAGLSWLRRHRQLTMPVGAWVAAFCPHPYWLYRNLDVTYVMHSAAVAIAERAEPGLRVVVGALPVRDAFAPADRASARARLGVADDRFTVVLCTGSLGFGGVDRAVTALLAAGPQVQVIAICGRNELLRTQLAARGEPSERLLALGWTDDMPGWMTASDVVVTNAGGATALEAVASGRPVIMFEPIAGHGRANAALLASAGFALLAASSAELTGTVRRLTADPVARAAQARPALAQVADRRREDDLAALAAMPGRGPAQSFPVRAEDALFLHVQTQSRPQQIGAVAMLDGGGMDLAGLRSAVFARVGQNAELRRRLLPARGRWARARWVVDATVEVAERVTEVTVGAGGAPSSLNHIVARYFAEPLDPLRATWQLLLVHGGPGLPSAIVVKVHHALGDGYALIAALSGLLDPRQERHALGQTRFLAATARGAAVLALPRRAVRVARGLIGMSLAGPPPPIGGRPRVDGAPVDGAAAAGAPVDGAEADGAAADQRPGFASVSLDARAVTITARRLGATQSDLVLALVADAVGRAMAGRGVPTVGQNVRALVPSTLRAAERGAGRRADDADPEAAAADGFRPGNRTTGLLLDLPVGPMAPAERVAAVRAVRQARSRRGDADAAAFVLRAMNLMPQPLQRAFARATFTSRRFNLIVSVFPGMRRARYVLGTKVTAVFPVLALASGVGLAVGAMTWGQALTIGLTLNLALIPDPALLAAGIRDAFAASERGARELAAGELPIGGSDAGRTEPALASPAKPADPFP